MIHVPSANLGISKNHRFPWKLSLILYGISYLPSLFSANALFWDDWVTVDPLTNNIPRDHYAGSGRAPWSNFFESVLLGSSPIAFRLFTIVAFFAAGYFFFKILSTTNYLNEDQLIAITLLFLVVPVNSARIAMITNSYTFSYLFFFLGWYIFTLNKPIALRFLSLLCFFLSFTSLAMLTFVILPVISELVRSENKTKQQLTKSILKILPLLLLPIVYLVSRELFWAPSGGYAKMYTPQLLGIIRALLFVSVCSIPLVLNLASIRFNKLKKPNLLIAAGCFSISIAAFPYMIGGHLVDISDWLITFVPNFSDWESRHQLTLPLGISLIIVGSMKLEKVKNLRWNTYPVLSTVLAIFVVLNFTYAQEYFLDSRKQDAVLEAMASNPDLQSVKSIYIDDKAVRFNARGRLIRSYEWERMLEKALGSNSIKVSYLQYPDCNAFQPDSILHITSPNGRLESTLRGDVVIDLSVEKINPCNN